MLSLLTSANVAASTSWASLTSKARKAALLLIPAAVLLAGVAEVRGQWLDDFNPNANGAVSAVVIQPDGKILIGGYFTTLSPNGGAAVTRNYIARLNPDGTLDAAFNPNANDAVYAIAVQADGKILAGGRFTSMGGQPRNRIARLDAATGLPDSFDPSADYLVEAIAIDSSGKILAAGGFLSIGGQTRKHLARLDATTGAADSFNPSANQDVSTIALQADGKILVGGAFNTGGSGGTITIGGQSRNFMARLDPMTGLADSFDPHSNSYVDSIAVQPDGKILVSGSFSSISGGNSIGGQPRNRMARLDSVTGLADSFNPNPSDAVNSIAIQADGNILVGGDFLDIGGQPRDRIARLDSTTGLADSYNPNASDGIRCVAVQVNGDVLAGGSFSVIGGHARNRIARLTTFGPTPTPPGCATFSNSATITIPASGVGGISSPYPSNIAVSGLGGAITQVTVAMNGITHTWPTDIDVLLVGPEGQNAIIMSDIGGYSGVSGIDLILDDTVANLLPNGGPLVSNTYHPNNIQACDGKYPIDTFPAPAPTPSGASLLSVFNGTNPNGTWSLYVVDDGFNSGRFSGGWAITVLTDNCAGPTATPMPTPTPGGATHFAVNILGSVLAGYPFNFSVTALDESNNPVTSYGGTVHFTSSDYGATLPGDAGLTNGTGIFSASLIQTFTYQAITATDTSNSSITGTTNCAFIGKTTPPPSLTISGRAGNCASPAPTATPPATPTPPALPPVSSVTITLTGSSSGTTLTDSSGNYSFTVAYSGSYTVTPAKTARSPGSTGINTVDVISTQRHFLNVGTPLSGCRLTAGDCAGPAGINTVDVIAIQRFFLGLTTGIGNVGKYKFNPANRTYTGIVTSQTVQNYDTLIFGDVAPPFSQ